jgi:hypothetical protein
MGNPHLFHGYQKPQSADQRPPRAVQRPDVAARPAAADQGAQSGSLILLLELHLPSLQTLDAWGRDWASEDTRGLVSARPMPPPP